MDNNTHNGLYEKLSRLQWLLGRHQMHSHMAHGPFGDTSRGQGRVLAMLKLQPEISTRDLSYLLGIRQQSLNELLNKLEKAGLVERKPAEADRRVMMVRLTAEGRAQQPTDTDHSSIFDCLLPEEQQAFADYLDRVITALEEQLGTGLDEEETEEWMRSARSRMGNEVFERMMDMRGGFGHHGRGGVGPDGRGAHARHGFQAGPDDGHFGHGHPRHGFGSAPDDERFGCSTGNPMPHSGRPDPFHQGPGHTPPPPAPGPKPTEEPETEDK